MRELHDLFHECRQVSWIPGGHPVPVHDHLGIRVVRARFLELLLHHPDVGSVVEQVAAWGENSSSGSVFGPSECWALRRGRVYLVEDSGTDLLCPHVGDASPPGYLCVPLTAPGGTIELADAVEKLVSRKQLA